MRTRTLTTHASEVEDAIAYVLNHPNNKSQMEYMKKQTQEYMECYSEIENFENCVTIMFDLWKNAICIETCTKCMASLQSASLSASSQIYTDIMLKMLNDDEFSGKERIEAFQLTSKTYQCFLMLLSQVLHVLEWDDYSYDEIHFVNDVEENVRPINGKSDLDFGESEDDYHEI